MGKAHLDKYYQEMTADAIFFSEPCGDEGDLEIGRHQGMGDREKVPAFR